MSGSHWGVPEIRCDLQHRHLSGGDVIATQPRQPRGPYQTLEPDYNGSYLQTKQDSVASPRVSALRNATYLYITCAAKSSACWPRRSSYARCNHRHLVSHECTLNTRHQRRHGSTNLPSWDCERLGYCLESTKKKKAESVTEGQHATAPGLVRGKNHLSINKSLARMVLQVLQPILREAKRE